MNRGRYPRFFGIMFLVLPVGLLALGGEARSQPTIHKNGFESKPGWIKGAADGLFEEIVHRIDDREPHNGQASEFIEIDVKKGESAHYVYPTGKAPIVDEMRAALWLRANRPGIQLKARVVLPKERDPNNIQYSMVTYIDGDAYQQTGQWQLLELGRAVTKLAKQRQQLLNAQEKRSIDFTDAYVDALVLNLNAGPGPTKVWIDDLEIGPVLTNAVAVSPERIDNNNPPKISTVPRPAGKNSPVQFNGNRIMVGNQRMFFRAIRYTDTMLPVLRNAGFNTVCFDGNVSQAMVNEAADLGMWIVPEFRVMGDDRLPLAPEEITKQVNRFADNDAVLFRRVGGLLAFEQATLVSRATQVARAADPGHPIAVDVWDGMMPYSRSANLLGVSRYPLMTTLELPKYREFLESRRKLAPPGVFTWTWIQTHLPDWHADLLYNQAAQAEFKDPVGPQPEHIRLLTYTALASGCRGLAYSSDRFLADSHQGRDRLLSCALLNQEMDMLRDLLVTIEDPPQWIDTSVRDIKAAVMRCNQGVLVIPIWQGKFSQFVPGQAATAKLAMVVPQVPKTTQAWEVSPGDVRGLKVERVDKGLKVVLPEFGLTSLVVFTSDTTLIGKFQDQARSRRQLAAQWSHDMALYEYEKVVKVHAELEKMGVTLPDGNALLEDARKRLQKSKELWDSRNFAEAYHEANRALRPVRILMRAHWEKAVRGLDTPVASPYAVSFYTLPKHWQMMAQKANMTVGANLLRGGDFELPPERVQENWKKVEETLDNVVMTPIRVAELPVQRAPSADKKAEFKPENPAEGRQCLMLNIKPRLDQTQPLQALERTTLALTSPEVRLPPGTLVQISGWVNIPAPITASPDGALLYDNAGGEPLALRWTDPMPWKKFVMYRRVPASGNIYVTVAMTGVGTVYFDDLRIEPLIPSGGN